MEFVWDAVVAQIEGDGAVNRLRLKSTKDDTISALPVAGVFVAIGLDPNTSYLQGVVPLDKGGYIVTNEIMETGIPGIFAAGDVRHNSVKQAIVAAGDGATAAVSAEKFLSSP
jgi:thioredoxin reductase (NADPH)